MLTSELVGLHDIELLDAIIKHYEAGTLPEAMPLHREHIEVVTEKTVKKEVDHVEYELPRSG